MHITTEELSGEKSKPERDKKIFLNIPVGGKSEILTNTKGNRDTLLRSKCQERSTKPSHDDLTKTFENLNLSDDESSDLKELLESELISKSPDKPREAKREQQRAVLHPYNNQVTFRVSSCLPSGGGASIQHLNYTQTVDDFQFSTGFEDHFHQIPQIVKDHETNGPLDHNYQNSIKNMLAALNDGQKQLLFHLVDKITSEDEVRTAPRIIDTCNSPDSSYGTMSPASVPPSPFSMHSPNPRNEQRLSESDSTGDYELAAMEMPFGVLDIGMPQLSLREGSVFDPSPPRIPQSTNIQSQPPSRFRQVVSQGMPRPLCPESVEVNEVGLEKPAVERMRKEKLRADLIKEVEYNSIVMFEINPILKETNTNSASYQRKKENLKNQLFDLIRGGQAKNKYFYEKVYVRVQLYKKHFKDILLSKDENGESLLYVAAFTRNDCPLIVRYLADVIAENKESYLETLDGEGNSILHYIASKGDRYAQVLSEILHSKAFDVNLKNARSETAIHKAVKAHPNVYSLAIVKQLIKNKATVTVQDLQGSTPLHLAVTHPQQDPQLLRALLQSDTAHEAVNTLDTDRNTPLHIAAKRSDLPFRKHTEIFEQLIRSRARHDIRNNDEKVALALVAADRKEEMKFILKNKK